MNHPLNKPKYIISQLRMNISINQPVEQVHNAGFELRNCSFLLFTYQNERFCEVYRVDPSTKKHVCLFVVVGFYSLFST